jgi:hypothetical protein
MVGSGWLWFVVDVIFVALLGLAMAWGASLRRGRHGEVRPSPEALKPDTEARRTGRYSRWQDWLALILGIWLFVAPWLIWPPGAFGGQVNASVIGALLALLALASIYRFESPQEIGMLIVAVWLFVSPWLFGFAGSTFVAWSHWIVAAVVAGLAVWDLTALRSAAPMRTDGRSH